MSPGTSCKGFPQYLETRNALLQRLAAHPAAARHVIRIHDVYPGILVRGYANPKVVLATEPVPPTLADRLQGAGLEPGARWEMARQLVAGVAALHEAGIDWVLIDPWHIGVRADGSPVLLDSLCARVHEESSWWDLPWMTEGYTAPELLEGENSSPAADVYALAATLATLLREGGAADFQSMGGEVSFVDGLPPFDGERLDSLLRSAMSEDPGARPTAEALAAFFRKDGERGTEELLPDPPQWLTAPLQALAFWVAYQHCIYRHHDLPEGAIVAEFTRLVDAEVGLDRIVVREPLYRDLQAPCVATWDGAHRCDLAVRGKGKGKQHGPVEVVVEVKRASAADAVINADLGALHQLKKVNPSIRAFMLVVSQARQPRRWVGPLGTANREVELFTVTSGSGADEEVRVRARRVTKAANSFRSIQKASYCCLLEVV